jgi:hypothetical protein
MMDFTLKKYHELLVALQNKDYTTMTFEEYLQETRPKRFVILRHDVDKKPKNSLAAARVEASLGMKSSYYFRAVPKSWDEVIIKEIASLGHEIGYHYESLATCNGNITAALHAFEINLNKLREMAPVATICMHGSPRSKYDNRQLWESKSYHDFGIIGEPYFDIDFSQVFYLTDTGRRWDGFKVSVRDKIPVHQERWCSEGLVFHSTDNIISAVNEDRLPYHIMMTTHPQRWNDRIIPWTNELVMQRTKNIMKKLLIG